VRRLTFVIVFACGCATAPVRLASDPSEWASWPEAHTPPPPAPGVAPPLGVRLAAKATELVGLSTLKLVAPQLPDDCTGLVRAVYEGEGAQLLQSGQAGDNGVTAMWRYAFQRSALHTHRPAPGDLVFFRETYDRNRDGLENDGLTHVGVVESVDAAGTVTFVHRSGKGVTRAKLDLGSPLDKARNDFLRPRSKRSPALLTGELFVTFAAATRLLD
jgi:hypothetical protein